MQASFPWVRTLEGCIPDVGMNCTWTSSCKNCRTTWTLISPWNGIDVTQPPLLPGAWQEQMSGAGRRGSHPRPQIISANNLKCSVWCTLKKKIITTHVYLNNNSSAQKNNLEWSMENQSVENKYKEEDKRHCGIPSRQPPSNPPEIYTLKKITPDCTRVGLCDWQNTVEEVVCHFWDWVMRDTAASLLGILAFTPLTLGNTNGHVMKTLRQPCGS